MSDKKHMKSQENNIWNYLTVAWIGIWLTAAIVLIFVYRLEIVASVGFFLLPFILCGFFIPFFLLYDKSDLPISSLKNKLLTINPKRPKNIHYLCVLAIPGTVIFIAALLISPDMFLEYGPKYNEQYAYNLAFMQFLCLIAYLGFWYVKRWAIYFYIIAVVTRVLVINYGLDIPFRIGSYTWDLFVIVYGYLYIPKNSNEKS